MEVSITLKDWKYEEAEGTRKIVGNYVMKCGATEIGVQSFNGSYANVKIPFSTGLMVEVERLTEMIVAEITKNFSGGK
jgi:putative methionine-R-sulfoxide reductase with GAF domain